MTLWLCNTRTTVHVGRLEGMAAYCSSVVSVSTKTNSDEQLPCQVPVCVTLQNLTATWQGQSHCPWVPDKQSTCESESKDSLP